MLKAISLSSGGTPGGAAGGSLSGTYPNPGIATDVNLPGSPTTTTQLPGDNSTKIATTAYVTAGYVPYNGATGSVDLGINNLQAAGLIALGVGTRSITVIGTGAAMITLNDFSGQNWLIASNRAGSNEFTIVDQQNSSAVKIRINQAGDVILNPTTGGVLIGTTSGVASAQLAISSTTRGFLPPAMTTTQKNAISSPASGLVVYDNVLNELQFYNGSSWFSNAAKYVPYTGAIANVDLGTFSLSATRLSIGTTDLTSSVLYIAPTFENRPLFYLNATNVQNTFYSRIRGTLTTTTATISTALELSVLMTPTNGSVPAAYQILISPRYAATGSIGSAYGIYVSASTNTGTSIDNVYGGYFSTSTIGAVVNTALYTDNIVVGSDYAAITPPSKGMIVKGVVGINMSSPIYFLDIAGGLKASSSAQFFRLSTTDASPTRLTIQNITSATATAQGYRIYVQEDTIAGRPLFLQDPNGAASPIIIGTLTNDTNNKLQVTGNSAFTGNIGINLSSGFSDVLNLNAPTASGYSGLSLWNNGAIKWSVRNDFVANSFYIGDAGTYWFAISQSTGRFGLGTITTTGGYVTISSPSDATKNTIFITGTQVGNGTNASVNVMQMVSTIAPTFSGSIGDVCAGVYASLTFSPSSGTTIPTACNIFVAGGTQAGAGTVTTGYGILINPVLYGTTRNGLYVAAPTGGTTRYTAYFDAGVSIGALYANQQIGLRINSSSLSTLFYNTYSDGLIIGTDNGASNGGQMGLGVVHTFSPTNGAGNSFNIYCNGIFSVPSAKTVSAVYGMYVGSTFSGNVGTINSAYGIRIDAGSVAAGTISNHTALWVDMPSAGAARRGLYLNGTANELIMGINANTSYQYWVDWRGSVTSASGTCQGFNLGITMAPTAAVTTAQHMAIYAQWNASAAITSAVGLYIDVGSTAGTAPTTGYNLYCRTPAFGSSKVCAYFEGFVGFGQVIPGYQVDVAGTVRIAAAGGTSFSDTSRALDLFSGGGTYRIGFDSLGGTVGYIRHNVVGGSTTDTWGHVFSGSVSGTPNTFVNALFISNSGNVAVGATTTSYKFQVTGGDIALITLGRTIRIARGTNACSGTGAVMVGGTITVSTTAIATGDIVLLMRTASGGTVGTGIPVVTIVNATSFTITSSSGLDTSTYSWVIIKSS